MSGSGEPGDPFDIALNDAWAERVAEGIERPRIYYEWRRSLFQSIPSGVTTVVNPDTYVGNYPSVTWISGSVITIPVGLAGVYLMTGNVIYASTALGNHRMQFRINGGTRYFPCAGAIGSGFQAGTIATYLGEGSTVELQTAHTNGGAVNITAYFEIYRLPDDNPFLGGP